MWEADLNKNSPMRGIIIVPIVLGSATEVRKRDKCTLCQGRDVRSAKTVGKPGWPGCPLCAGGVNDERLWLRKWKCNEKLHYSAVSLLMTSKTFLLQQHGFNFLLSSRLLRPICKARSNLEWHGGNYSIMMKELVFCKVVWHARFVSRVVVGESGPLSLYLSLSTRSAAVYLAELIRWHCRYQPANIYFISPFGSRSLTWTDKHTPTLSHTV